MWFNSGFLVGFLALTRTFGLVWTWRSELSCCAEIETPPHTHTDTDTPYHSVAVKYSNVQQTSTPVWLPYARPQKLIGSTSAINSQRRRHPPQVERPAAQQLLCCLDHSPVKGHLQTFCLFGFDGTDSKPVWVLHFLQANKVVEAPPWQLKPPDGVPASR